MLVRVLVVTVKALIRGPVVRMCLAFTQCDPSRRHTCFGLVSMGVYY